MTRLDCVSLGIVVNRDGLRFYDEGEDFWPKRYAIWGRLIAQQPEQIAYAIIDRKAIGRFMPSVFPPLQAGSIRELAALLELDPDVLEADGAGLQRRGAPRHASTTPGSTTAAPRASTPPKSHWARPLDTPPFYGYPLRPGITFTYLGRRGGRARARPDGRRPAGREPVRGGRDHGRQRPRPGLSGRLRHDHRHRVRPHRGRGGRGPCPRLRCCDEARRVMTICNACRYCEGFCAVFPAMELRLEFAAGDLIYLANLCHDCGACYHACQYAPPHEFAVNVPAAFRAAARARPSATTPGPAPSPARSSATALRPGWSPRRASRWSCCSTCLLVDPASAVRAPYRPRRVLRRDPARA